MMAAKPDEVQSADRTTEARQSALERLALDALNGLASPIVVLDGDGRIAAANHAWHTLARTLPVPCTGWVEGGDYVDLCRHFGGTDHAGEMAEGIGAVAAGHRESFTRETAFDGAFERRWFLVRVTPFPGSAFRHVIVSHEDITALKQAEETTWQGVAELRLFRKVIESIHDVVVITEAAPLDPPGPRILYVNPAFERLTGYPAAEVLGDTLRILHGPKTDPAALDTLRSAMERREKVRVELTNYRRDGGTFEVEIEAIPLSDEAGEVKRILVVQRDITGRRRAEDDLRASEERLRLFIEYAPAGVAMFDRNMCYLAASRRWKTDYGLPDDLLGRSHYELFPEIPARWRAIHKRGLAGETLHADEDPFLRADGSTQWLQWDVRPWRRPDGEIGGILIGAEDVTARVLAQKALRENEERLRYSLQAAKAGSWVWEAATGEIECSPDNFELYDFDLSQEHPRFADWESRIHPDDLARVRQAVQAVVSEVRPEFRAEFRVVHRSGAIRWLLGLGRMQRTTEGTVRMFGINLDITERKETEEALRQSQAQLEAALSSMTDAVFISDAAGRFLHFNEAFATFHRFSSKDECARTLAEYPAFLDVFLDTGERAPLDMWAVPRALRGETAVDAEYTLRRKDTGETWVGSYNFSPIRDGNGAIVGSVVTGRDVTAQKRAAAALHRSEERFSKAFSASPDGLVISSASDGVILEANQAFLSLFGLRPLEAIGRRSMDLDLFAEPADRERALQRLRAEGHLRDYEVVVKQRSGETRIVRLSAEWIEMEEAPAILTVLRDVTAQKRAEAESARLEGVAQHRAMTLEAVRRVALDVLLSRTGPAALQHIAEAARTLIPSRYSAVGVTDAGGGRFRHLVTAGLAPGDARTIGPHPAAEGVLGLLLNSASPLRVNDLRAHPAAVGFPPGHPPMRRFLGVPIRRGTDLLGGLYVTDREDGQPFTEDDEATITALGDYAAVAICFQQLLEQQTVLTQGFVNTLEEERRALAYDLHDGLTQYVMASYAYMEGFQEAQASGDSARAADALTSGLRYLREAVVESRRLVSGLRSLALEDLGLVGAIEQLIREEEHRAGWEEADFRHDLDPRAHFDRALETAVYRVAQEALTNARKHARTRRVRILLRSERRPQTGAESLVLEVRDWGIGFDSAPRPSRHHHLGLRGMAERVRLMDGEFTVTTAPGQGTAVRAVFPFSRAAEVREPAAPTTAAPG